MLDNQFLKMPTKYQFPLTKEFIIRNCEIDLKTGCWLWKLSKNRQGYGITSEFCKDVMVHRRMYELCFGTLGPDLCALHNCPFGDNPSCCNPDHLWRGTRGDNNRDTVKKGRHVIVNRKLTPEQIISIRSDERTQQEIASDYSVHQNTISRVKLRKGYTWVA